MSTADLKAATGTAAAAAKSPKDFPAMLTAWLPEIRRALPKHLNADRMSRIALTAFRRTPKLGLCDPRSVFAAVIQASQLGLEPDTLGRSYLIPYKANKKTPKGWESHYECQFVPGWKGLVDLMNRSGQGTVYTGVIFKDQEYEYLDGSRRELTVKNETELVDPLDITHAFAVGHIKNGMFPVIELWRIGKVTKHRDRYNKVGKDHYSFENLEMYSRKVVLLQVLKYMPCSAELATAMALSDAAEIGAQKIDLNDAIEGVYQQVPDEDGVIDGAGDAAGGGDAGAGAAGAAGAGDAPDPAESKRKHDSAVVDTCAKLGEYNDIELMSVYADEVPEEIKADDRFTRAFQKRMGEIKGAGKKK